MKSQFYLMENPKTGDTNDQFIFHAKKPQFIAKIISFEDDVEMVAQDEEGENITFFYINSFGFREIYTLTVVRVFDTEEEKIQSKLKRMADWWASYLVWEDQQQGRRGGTTAGLPDYNQHCKGLKILYSTHSQRWCVIYNGIVKTFDNEIEMDDFLIQKLYFKEIALEKGKIIEI